jgi:hypothetical protein
MSTLLNESTLGTLDMAGDSYPREIDYEVDPEDGAILIHAVRLVKKVCEKDGVWYDPNGDFHCGEKWIRLDVTDFLSAAQIGAFADEIQSERRADAEDWSAECARDRAIERWLDARANGPHHYPGAPVN